VQAPSTGTYVFQTESDDGVRLWVNNQLVIDNWTKHAPTLNNSPSITLAANSANSIKLEYYDGGFGAVIRLRWKVPGSGSFVTVPKSRLSR
jgi:PA14 domain